MGLFLQEYAEKKWLMSQPRRRLISSFELINDTTVTPLLLFYLKLELLCTKIQSFVESTPVKWSNSFVQSTVDTRRQRNKNPNSGVVAETTKLLANSPYDYQIMDRGRHSITRYTNDKKTHAAIKNKMFKRLGYINHQLYEVEIAKSATELKESTTVALFILQYATLRMLELYCIFFTKFYDTDKMEIGTD